MFGIGIWQLLLILIIVFVFFGAGKLPRVMGDVGKGVRALRDGLKGDEDTPKETVSHASEEATIVDVKAEEVTEKKA